MTPSSTFVLRRNLATALSRNSLTDAAEILEHLKAEDPLSQETRTLELEYHFRAGHRAEAAALREDLLLHYPASPRVRFLAGRMDYEGRRYDAALEHFEESDRLAPHAALKRYRGKTLTQLGRYAEAEAILEPLSRSSPESLSDLAWLHERKGNLDQALAAAQSLAARKPESEFARGLVQRLKTRLLGPDELREEVESLTALGEEVPEDVLVQQTAALLRSGQGKEARQLIAKHKARLGTRAAVSLAWECYKLQAFDLSLDFFLAALPERASDVKLLSALEKSAEKCGRIHDVFEAYKPLAPAHKPLFGRMRSLSGRVHRRPEE